VYDVVVYNCAHLYAVVGVDRYVQFLNMQIGVERFKHVIVCDPLHTGHVIRRMRGGRVCIFNGNQWEML